MNTIIIILLLIVSMLILFSNGYTSDLISLKPSHSSYSMTENNILLPTNKITEDTGFIKPEQRLFSILSSISSGNKVNLTGLCKSLMYTKHTFDSRVEQEVIQLIKYNISTLNVISSTNYYIKEIENAYIQTDTNNNQRYILDFFMYDVKNYYTVRVVTDIVIIDKIVYMNYINVLRHSHTNIVDRYNYKFNSQGILLDSNMFQENMHTLLNKSYKQNYKVIGVNDTKSEYSDVDLSTVISLHSLANKYLPSHLSKETYYDYKKKDLDSYLEMYYPQNMNTIKSPQFCQKYTTEWDSFGNPHELETTKTCVTDHNQYSIEYNQPWFGPGVMYDRTSKDKYSWLKDPARGNIIRAQGY